MNLRCPDCGGSIPHAPISPERPARTSVTCSGCSRAYPSYCGIADLRKERPPTCWTEARTIPEEQLVDRMAEKFHDATLADLIEEYAGAHRLPPRLQDDDRSYMFQAAERERWTTLYMDFSFRRYAGRELRGRAAVDAGCGSGGSLPHLAERFENVTGIDPDLAALLVAAKRLQSTGHSGQVSLVAAMLEQPVLETGVYDAVKCTDVIEHVADPEMAVRMMASALAPGGAIFVLTPNKWSLFNPEPHVKLWGVQFLPQPLADRYVRRRVGVNYSDITTLLSYGRLRRVLRQNAGAEVRFIPIEDKHLNPASRRGATVKRALTRPPFRWLSSAVSTLQPTLGAMAINSGGSAR